MLYRLLLFMAIVLFATSTQAQPTEPQVQFHTSAGSFTVTLNPKAAPKTVENFLNYVQSGFYNGTIFHRVKKGFMIQGGGFSVLMQKKQTQAPITNEADNGLKNIAGTIAMARTRDPHSATSQFFINVVNNDFLNHSAKNQRDWGYCVFGKVTKGMEVIKAIENVKTTFRSGRSDVPDKPIIIKSATQIAEKKSP